MESIQYQVLPVVTHLGALFEVTFSTVKTANLHFRDQIRVTDGRSWKMFFLVNALIFVFHVTFIRVYLVSYEDI